MEWERCQEEAGSSQAEFREPRGAPEDKAWSPTEPTRQWDLRQGLWRLCLSVPTQWGRHGCSCPGVKEKIGIKLQAKNLRHGGWGCSSAVKQLPGMFKALGSDSTS